MAATTSIPRFLLPQSSSIWRRFRVPNVRRTGQLSVRFVSKDSKPIVLEKPERFNPPSHGARLPKRSGPRHYGGDLSAPELQAQGAKEYPGLMAPKGTWSHWIWHSHWLHSSIALGTLAGLAIFTFAENFKRSSPYADMVPAWSDFFAHPITSGRMMVEVLRLSEMNKAEQIQGKRDRQSNDVAKRTVYRKAHGLPVEQGLSWTMGDTEGEAEAAADGTDKPRKKWLGIF